MSGRSTWTGLVAAAVLILAGCGAEFDVIIEGGKVLDGTGSQAIQADVASSNGRLAAIGDLSGRSAGRRVDAAGLVVTPGFIDVHSHAGPGLETAELSHGEPLLRQGITTVFANPDGGGPVDVARQRLALEAASPGVNVALLVPHGSVRREVMGMENRHATPDEVAEMAALVQAGKDAGAFGLSSGLFYTPGSFAALSEVVELARVFGKDGVYTSHIRDESDYSIGLMAAIEEVITVAEQAETRGIVTHIKALGPHVWGFSEQAISRIESARASGIDVWADQYPYEASATSLTALVSRPLLAGGFDSLVVRLETLPKVMRADITSNLERRGGAGRIQFRRFAPDPSVEGLTLAEVAGNRGTDAVGAAMELLREGSAGIVSHNMVAADVERFMGLPWVMTSSDGGLVPMGEGVPHPRNYGSFPRKIALYVTERGTLPLATAVRSMTGLPADVMGMSSRGYLREGLVADVVIFDPARLRDRATYTEPHQLSEGVVYLFVAGQLAIDQGSLSSSQYGQVLTRGID
ncbi:MAG: N-acyl-D-amino-acid deacylase [Thalassolituus oleivorans]